ncbi:hypothetical protein MAP00_000047 [Monascus purpureus]|nr:hypothetical protein MAP00_000047 [Monascus purpureus]
MNANAFLMSHYTGRNKSPTAPLTSDEPSSILCSAHLIAVILVQRDNGSPSTKEAAERLGRKASMYTAVLASQESVSSLTSTVLKDGHGIGIQRRHPSRVFSQDVVCSTSSPAGQLTLIEPRCSSPITPAKGGSIIHVASLVPFQGGLTVPSFNGFFIHIVQDAHACGAIGNSNTAPFDEITSPQVVNLVSVLAECIKPREKRVCELNLVRSSRRKLTPAGPGREAYAVYRLDPHEMGKTILLRNALILVRSGESDDHVVPLREHSLLIEGNRISKIAPQVTAPSAETLVIDCTGRIISPGFIDTHHHLWQTQLKGRHANHTLLEYMPSGNMQSANYAPEDVFWGELGGFLAALDAGTTTVVDYAHINCTPENSRFRPICG